MKFATVILIKLKGKILVDIVKEKTKQRITKKMKVILLSVVSFIVLIMYIKATMNNVQLARKDLIFATVKKGDLAITVDGYGKLVSDKLKLITSLTRATVKEIVLKPGANVKKDSVIVQLENPELLQQVDNAKQELSQKKANLRQLKVNHQRELLDEDSNLAELDARYEMAKLRRVAEEKLVKDGIVSEIAYRESVLNEEQLAKRIDIQTVRLKQLATVHKEAINIMQERIKQQQGLLNVAKQRVDRLTVRSGIDGVLQSLSVNLGQSLSAGQEIALIGSVDELIALIKVPQNQAQLVEVGQVVNVDTRQDIIQGVVTRIDPIVSENTVEIEVSLPQQLPSSARPEQNIDATIIAATLSNVSYIDRPANVKSGSELHLYKLTKNNDEAVRTKLKFGQKTGRYIEVSTGASIGDSFIISDLQNYKIERISIN
jgi:multidrug efflux pump subunit AcrA (membrane-fusion protein)